MFVRLKIPHLAKQGLNFTSEQECVDLILITDSLPQCNEYRFPEVFLHTLTHIYNKPPSEIRTNRSNGGRKRADHSKPQLIVFCDEKNNILGFRHDPEMTYRYGHFLQ